MWNGTLNRSVNAGEPGLTKRAGGFCLAAVDGAPAWAGAARTLKASQFIAWLDNLPAILSFRPDRPNL